MFRSAHSQGHTSFLHEAVFLESTAAPGASAAFCAATRDPSLLRDKTPPHGQAHRGLLSSLFPRLCPSVLPSAPGRRRHVLYPGGPPWWQDPSSSCFLSVRLRTS